MTEAQDFIAARARGAKSQWEICKSSVESAYGENTVWYSQINYLIKVGKDKKFTKLQTGPPMLGFLLLLLFRKSGSGNVKLSTSRRLLLCSW
jgi:hypothetical protein